MKPTSVAKRKTKVDIILDALEVAIAGRWSERQSAKPRSSEFHHADGARDGLLEAEHIVENIKEYGHT